MIPQVEAGRLARHALLIGAALVVALIWAYWLPWPDDPEQRLSWVGMALQLAGVAIAVYGTEQIRRRLGRLPWWRASAATAWTIVKDIEARFTESPAVVGDLESSLDDLVLVATGTTSSGAHGTLSLTLDERVDILERKFAEHAGEIAQLRSQLANETSAREQAISAAQDTCTTALRDLRVLLDDVQTGGVVLAFGGLIWLAFGIALTSIPGWLASHLLEH